MRLKSISGGLLFLFVLCAMPGIALADGNQWDFQPRVTHVPILMYHYVDTPPANADPVLLDLTVTRANFIAQMKWLKANGYQSITPDQLMNALWHGAKLPAKPVLLTFDDGYANAWYNVTPILKQFGYTGTFFVITNFVDQSRSGYLTWSLARQMQRLGMAIQDHTATHEDVRDRSHAWYQAEFVTSAKDIQKQIGIRPRYFCYPSGGYDDVAIHELQAAGFWAAFTENDSRYEYASNTFRLPRVRIRGSMNVTQFAEAVTDKR